MQDKRIALPDIWAARFSFDEAFHKRYNKENSRSAREIFGLRPSILCDNFVESKHNRALKSLEEEPIWKRKPLEALSRRCEKPTG